MTDIDAYIDATINTNNNNNNNNNNTVQPDSNGTARDQIFCVVGRFPIIQVLGIRLKISEL